MSLRESDSTNMLGFVLAAVFIAVVGAAVVGTAVWLTAGVIHGYMKAKPVTCCALLHKHPPHDSLGQGQQEGRAQYGSDNPLAREDRAERCMAAGGVPHWAYYQDQRYTIECVLPL